MTRWNAGSVVVALTALLGGCTGVSPDTEPRPPSVAADSGGFEVRRGRPGLVIGVPDAGSDLVMSRDLARLTGFGLVAVTDGRRVGRGMRAAAERSSLPAPIGNAYGRRAVEVAQGPILLYVEVQGQESAARAMALDIGTVGLTSADAWRIKTLFELIRDSRLEGADGTPLAITVAKWDAYRAPRTSAVSAGSASWPERALYIGLPRSARTTYREAYTGILADFLLQSVTVLVPRQR